jgi:hypothetical protein
MLRDISEMPVGTVYLVAVRDEASNQLSLEAKEFFGKMGSSEVLKLGFRDSWAFIGVKG